VRKKNSKLVKGNNLEKKGYAVMAVFRVEKNKGYTVMSNHHLKNRALSLKAKGLLSLMLSLPDDWTYTMKGLAVISVEGIDAIRQTLAELEKHRYVVRSRVRDEKGCLRGSEYVVYEQPPAQAPDCADEQTEPGETAQGEPTLENPMLENPTLGSPTLENTTQLNTNEKKTNPTKTTSLSSPSVLTDKETTDRRDKADIDDQTITTCEMLIKANIGYEDFQESQPGDIGMVNEIIRVMVDALTCKAEYLHLDGEHRPRLLVCRRLLELDHWRVEHVLGQFKAVTEPVKRKRRYILTMLYNTALEFEAHYTNQVAGALKGGGCDER